MDCFTTLLSAITLILFSSGFCSCSEELNSSEDDYAPFYELDEACVDVSSATLEDVNLIKNLNLPLTRGGKCLLACMFKKIDIISSDGHYQHEQCLSTIEKVLNGHPKTLTKALELIDLCSVEVANISDDEQGCEIAATIFSCVASYIKDSEFDSDSDEIN